MLDNVEYISAQVVKACWTCKLTKPSNEFSKNKRKKDGIDFHCKQCRREKDLIRKTNNPESYKKEKHDHYQKYKPGYRDRQLKRKFGINTGQYNEMFDSQDGRCKCCSTHQSSLKLALAVDHCHETNKVRGLLCGKCNTSIGLANEDVNILKSMIEYLEDNWSK